MTIKKINNPEIKGTINIMEIDNIKIHNYISPEDSTSVTTQIIETVNKLVVIDAQFLRPYAQEVKKYIQSLNKPIDRIIITHSHPDHWFGLEYFTDNNMYSLLETKQEIEGLGDIIIQSKKPILGDLIIDKKISPQQIIREGHETIDGLDYEFKKINNAEAGVQLLIKLPKLKILIAQDLVFNNVHLFIGQNAFDSWINNINYLKSLTDYKIILAGHGEYVDQKIYDQMIDYLLSTKKFFNEAKNGEELKNNLIKKYPDYKAKILLDISNGFLYK